MNGINSTMLGNLSQAVYPIERLISILAYIVSILFFINGLMRLKKIGDARARSSSQEKIFVPIAYILGASALLYLPSTLKVLSNTAFGTGNVLQYSSYNPYNVYNSMNLIIQLAGLIWFFRGCVLLVHSSEPNTQFGAKGFVFVCAGVLAMNMQATTSFINTIINGLQSLT